MCKLLPKVVQNTLLWEFREKEIWEIFLKKVAFELHFIMVVAIIAILII